VTAGPPSQAVHETTERISLALGFLGKGDNPLVERWLCNGKYLGSNSGHGGREDFHCEYKPLTLLLAQSKTSPTMN